MGANMVRRLMKKGHRCVVYDTRKESVDELVRDGAVGSSTLKEFVAKLEKPRAAWVMIPAAITDKVIDELASLMEKGDIIIDGGNSYFRDDRRRSAALAPKGINYIDCGTSGGVWGLERGYCLMIGGPKAAVEHLDAIFDAIAPGEATASPTPGRPAGKGTAAKGYLHCGAAGAGHFVKMVHNGIEYGLMAAYAEGLDILKHANADKHSKSADAETAPSLHGDLDYDLDLGEITELWRRGSVVGSWLLDLTAIAFQKDPELAEYSGRVSDSGEGRWTVMAAVEEAVPAPVLTSALYERFRSRKDHAFADKVCSAMRYQFGGHLEKSEGH
jgi:6-phosphogluconate dehydrogenase